MQQRSKAQDSNQELEARLKPWGYTLNTCPTATPGPVKTFNLEAAISSKRTTLQTTMKQSPILSISASSSTGWRGVEPVPWGHLSMKNHALTLKGY